MTKWEYMRRRVRYESLKGTNEELVSELNKWGSDGWELVHCNIEEFPKGECFAFCIFKRALPETPQDPLVFADSQAAREWFREEDETECWDRVWQKLDADERMRD